MSILTTFFNLIKPAKTDGVKVSDFNSNMDIIDTEMHKPPLSINGVFPDDNRNITLIDVPMAGNLSSDVAQLITGAFVERMSGNGSSVGDGAAFINSIQGNCVHTGIVEEFLDMDVDSTTITATLNRETFVAYVQESDTIVLTFTTSWSANPATYGVTVTGSPEDGDTITIEYIKASRGEITPAYPEDFCSTGWNLYDKTTGRAKVVKYSDEYGYKIGGNYTLVEFSTTVSGARTTITPNNGFFNITSDGYIFVTGGNNTTYIYATWSDWTDGYSGNFESYTVETVALSEAMENFPYGLCAVGLVRDEMNLNTQTAIQRIGRVAYSAENLATIVESEAAYEADESYIYYVLDTPVENDIDVDGNYICNDHGIEFFTGTDVPVNTSILYGENLKDKLRTDVVTISQQSLDATQKAQVLENIGAAALSDAVWQIGESVPVDYAVFAWAHNSTQLRSFFHTAKYLPSSGIRLVPNVTVSGIFQHDGTSVDITNVTVTASRSSQTVYFVFNGLSGLTTNATYLVKFSTTSGVTRSVLVESNA